MSIYLGAKYNLEELVKKHLFLICPNNSGSTFFENILETCDNTWNLKREGQWIYGYKGPTTKTVNKPLIWASTKQSLDTLLDNSLYDWSTTKKAWYFQSYSKKENASIFTTKTPPFLLIVDQLNTYFNNCHFIFMVRNPYAVVEGISRRKLKNCKSDENIFEIAAIHIMKCFEYQKKNIETFKNNSIFFTYEQMCDTPKLVEKMIKKFLPELYDLNLNQTIPVKKMYYEPLTNMNQKQISRLTKEEIKTINKVFLKNKSLMDFFGYEII